jgi:gas vesicle structural protein
VALTRESGSKAVLIEVLDRILDKGIVIDAWARVSLMGIDLSTVGTSVVMASLETHLN